MARLAGTDGAAPAFDTGALLAGVFAEADRRLCELLGRDVVASGLLGVEDALRGGFAPAVVVEVIVEATGTGRELLEVVVGAGGAVTVESVGLDAGARTVVSFTAAGTGGPGKDVAAEADAAVDFEWSSGLPEDRSLNLAAARAKRRRLDSAIINFSDVTPIRGEDWRIAVEPGTPAAREASCGVTGRSAAWIRAWTAEKPESSTDGRLTAWGGTG